MTNTYIVGTTVELLANFADENGNPVDPGAVTGEIRDPAGVVTQLVVTRDDLGAYSAPFTSEKSGLHQYRFAGESGAVGSTIEGAFMATSEF